ncbi:hypothetical protein VNO78_19028 [Psophocarpus tetragonolobus]|uniref:VQ domain-containing protein n=1 Tax=Psophocarpus tetragonolobus TaxID=3891 RepID=A0AAN9S8C8_PSOTE
MNGPRPSPLVINKDSQMIRKPSTKRINPIIIYTQSPKVIHTKAKDFMALVQRLTGRSSTNDTSPPQETSENFGSSLSDGSNNNSTETSSPLVQRSPSTDIPLFTPNSSDFFCSSLSSVYKYSDSPYGVLGSLISPSALEFIKELPEY